MSNKHVGTGFDDFVEQEGIQACVTAVAVKRVLAWQLTQEMQRQNLNKSTMIEKMSVSSLALDHLLDADNLVLNLTTLCSAAAALGKKINLELI